MIKPPPLSFADLGLLQANKAQVASFALAGLKLLTGNHKVLDYNDW
jgi:hypothetical protein